MTGLEPPVVLVAEEETNQHLVLEVVEQVILRQHLPRKAVTAAGLFIIHMVHTTNWVLVAVAALVLLVVLVLVEPVEAAVLVRLAP
jgi:hypothetical protein